MIDEAHAKMMFGTRFSCFGEFDLEDKLCKRYCALRIRCAVEKEQTHRMDLLEDVISPEMMYAITQ
jgi:hypothetical protein